MEMMEQALIAAYLPVFDGPEDQLQADCWLHSASDLTYG